jgi:hypothetical protein
VEFSTISDGTLNAVVTVQVGTQVSGTINNFVDFNRWSKGMLIAGSILPRRRWLRRGGPGARRRRSEPAAAVARGAGRPANARANVASGWSATPDKSVRVGLFQEGIAQGGGTRQGGDSSVAQLEAAR